ncbi:hypothetical protein DOTSEDRAFT_22771 [Dothistroma septosporum NZE10]|uniref:Uncharacterized protein n=1 Tax=Dothistroma septosporum (strain NZE10 / CBS 128990) TaxID=675120 RepID=N1PTE0_DOTSN|nr:hypothetical protein DOTSEDRAFT_22771 [Dothistroma septosporum NZE10]
MGEIVFLVLCWANDRRPFGYKPLLGAPEVDLAMFQSMYGKPGSPLLVAPREMTRLERIQRTKRRAEHWVKKERLALRAKAASAVLYCKEKYDSAALAVEIFFI